MPGPETWTRLEENTRRHDITTEALGFDKSHVDFTNDDFDRVLGALRAISQPGNLNAQLRQVRGAHRRARFALDQLMRELGVDRNYVQGVIDQMAILHPASFSPHPSLDELTVDELKKVIIALRKQAKREKERPGPTTLIATPGQSMSNRTELVQSSAHAAEEGFIPRTSL